MKKLTPPRYRTITIRPPYRFDPNRIVAQVEILDRRGNKRTLRKYDDVTAAQLQRLVCCFDFQPSVDTEALKYGEFIITYEV